METSGPGALHREQEYHSQILQNFCYEYSTRSIKFSVQQRTNTDTDNTFKYQ